MWAKKEGRQPVGMDAETALFPDDFETANWGVIRGGGRWGACDCSRRGHGAVARWQHLQQRQRGDASISGQPSSGTSLSETGRQPTKLPRWDLIFACGSTGQRVSLTGNAWAEESRCRGRDGMQASSTLPWT